jgi:hypothetical protein
MSLLDPPRCPQCDSTIDLKELWHCAPKTNRGSQFAGHVGIVCPVCGVKLRVTQGRVQLSAFVPFLFLIALCFLASRFVPLNAGTVQAKVTWALIFAIYVASFVIQSRSIPKLLALRYVREGEQVGYPLATLAEDLAAERQATSEDDLNQGPPADDRPEWTCKKCGEKNPGTFDICWKCQEARAGL